MERLKFDEPFDQLGWLFVVSEIKLQKTKTTNKTSPNTKFLYQ